MSANPVSDEIRDLVDRMSPDKQKQLLSFARQLARPRGTPGPEAVRIAREIGFSHEDLAQMEQAIEEW